jgi:hypothetical protein
MLLIPRRFCVPSLDFVVDGCMAQHWMLTGSDKMLVVCGDAAPCIAKGSLRAPAAFHCTNIRPEVYRCQSSRREGVKRPSTAQDPCADMSLAATTDRSFSCVFVTHLSEAAMLG